MTICISAICEQESSLVLASDAMLTNGMLSIQFEHPTRKMTRLSESCVALTAGDALAHTELFNMVQQEIDELKAPSVVDVVDNVKQCYQFVREREIVERILRPRGFGTFKDYYKTQKALHPDVIFSIQNRIDNYNYGLGILITAISDDTAHIYGVTDPGTSQCFDSIGFHAIGSGLPHALSTLIARGCHQSTPLEEALLIVYEAKKIAEKAPGVGSTITDICILEPSRKQPAHIVDYPRDRIEDLDSILDKWTRKDPEWVDDISALLKEVGVSKKW